MEKKEFIITLLLVFSISIIFISEFAPVVAQQTVQTNETKKTYPGGVADCGTGTYFNSTINECVLICPEGTVYVDDKCIIPKGFLDLSDNAWIGWGVLLAGIIAGVGIGITLYQQSIESKKRTNEIIQTYSSKIIEISNKESNLKTKQDCALYAEQYLDVLEEIATLALAGNFRKGIFNNSYGHITNYFNNNFAYGYDLWWWYHKQIHGFKDDYILEQLWKVPQIKNWKDTRLDEIYSEKEIAFLKNTSRDDEALRALQYFHKDDRWPDFRKLCRLKNITEFEYNYKGLGGYDDSKKNWRVLPDIMYYDYNEIPDEDGLSKSEYIEILKGFANDLSGFVEKEKDMTEPKHFEVYAEQYLETLEQIATLYKHGVLPTKESSYFENKFAYGCNLWEWYHKVVLHFTEHLTNALWYLPTQNPIDTIEDESITKKFDELKNKFEIILKPENTKNENLNTNTTELDDILTNIITTNRDYIVETGENSFDFLLDKARKDCNRKLSDQDIISKLVEEIKKIREEEVEKKFQKFKEKYMENEPLNVRFKKEVPDSLKLLTHKYIKPLIDEYLKENLPSNLSSDEYVNQKKKLTDTFLTEHFSTMEDAEIETHLKTFIKYYLANERWKDFRWWCISKKIDSFYEDPSEGLILPLKMWEAQYD